MYILLLMFNIFSMLIFQYISAEAFSGYFNGDG